MTCLRPARRNGCISIGAGSSVVDREGRTRLDIGGIHYRRCGASRERIWIFWTMDQTVDRRWIFTDFARRQSKPGDVAFLDRAGVALAMSTEHDTLLRISYPDQRSWLEFAERYRSWIVGGLWALATMVFLLLLQGIHRRRARTTGE